MCSSSDGQAWRFEDVVAEMAPDASQHVPLFLYRDVERQPPLKHVDFHSLYITERGRGVHVIDSTSYAISRGDVYVMGAGSEHVFVECDRLLMHAIHFPLTIFDPSTRDALTAVPDFDLLVIEQQANRRLHLDPATYTAVARDLAELWTEWRAAKPSGALLVRTLFLRLLLRLSRFAAGERPARLELPATVRDDAVVASALRTIDLNYGTALRVDELAASAHLSADHFSEIFAQTIGRTPRDYIRHVRLEHAKTLLETTALPVAQIARTIGMPDPGNFSRRFRTATGLNPSEFRRQAQS